MAALDLLTENEALAAVNSDDAGAHIEEFRQAVSAVSQVIDALCGPVVAREVTEVHDGGCRFIWPRQAPVLAVTTLTEFDGTTPTVLTDESTFGTAGTANGYALVDDGHRIERRSSGLPALFVARAGSVQLVYEAGRFADTESVGARFKYAAGAILRRLWKREGSAWAYTPDFYANTDAATTTSSFFRAVAPMVDEFLPDQRKPPGIA